MYKTGSMVWVLGNKQARVGLVLQLHKGARATVRVAGHGAIVVPVRRLRLMTGVAHVEGVMKFVVAPHQFSSEQRDDNHAFTENGRIVRELEVCAVHPGWV